MAESKWRSAMKIGDRHDESPIILSSRINGSVGYFVLRLNRCGGSDCGCPLSRCCILWRILYPYADEPNITKNIDLQKANLMPPEQTLPNDGLVVFYKSQNPMICGMALSLRRQEWQETTPMGKGKGSRPYPTHGDKIGGWVKSFNLNSAVGARQSPGKLLMLNHCLGLNSSTMTNPFGEALSVNNSPLTD